jgi:hypothetical protein
VGFCLLVGLGDLGRGDVTLPQEKQRTGMIIVSEVESVGFGGCEESLSGCCGVESLCFSEVILKLRKSFGQCRKIVVPAESGKTSSTESFNTKLFRY